MQRNLPNGRFGWLAELLIESMRKSIEACKWHFDICGHSIICSDVQCCNCWFPSKHVGRLVIIFHIGLFVVYMYNQMVWLTSGFTTKRYWTKTLTNERIVGSNTTNDSNYVVSLEAEGSSYENRIGSFCGFSGHHKNRSLWRRIGNVGARWPLELSIPDLAWYNVTPWWKVSRVYYRHW